MKTEFINNLKELKQNHEDLQRALERSGLKVTDHFAGTAKEKLVTAMHDIVSACEGLLRSERVEAHITRLDKGLPDALDFLGKIGRSTQGIEHASLVRSVERNVRYVQDHYRDL